MKLQDFIRSNRKELDTYIRQAVGKNFRIDDKERRLWILNDEYLYRWAQSKGVQI